MYTFSPSKDFIISLSPLIIGIIVRVCTFYLAIVYHYFF